MTGDRPGFGGLLPDLAAPPPGPASRAMAARLARVESRNVTYLSERWPVFWEEARGANVRDADGNVFLDLTGAFGVSLLGHGHPAVRAAIERQSERLVHGMGDVHPPSVKVHLLERLAAASPWEDTRVVLSTTGSDAVETALKTSRLASGRPGILALEGAYHGLTLGSLAVTERAHFRAPFSERLYPGVAFAPFPDPLRDPDPSGQGALDRVVELLAGGAPNGDPIGTVIVEPVQARGGARVPPPGFMNGLSEAARAHGALVVADEIYTGLGRCGSWLASPLVGLEPDVVCLGKALGGGLPLSACIAPARVMDAWPPSEGEAIHTSTFLGHPLSCAAATAVLETIDREEAPRRAREVGDDLRERLRAALEGRAGVLDVRGLGLLIGIELVEPGGTTPARGAGARVAERALAEGILVLPAAEAAHVVELSPPISLTKEQVAHAASTLSRIVEETL